MSAASSRSALARLTLRRVRLARGRAPRDGMRTIRLAVGFGVLAVAAAVFAVRVPAAFQNLAERAEANVARTPAERILVVADSLDLDNAFVLKAAELLPQDARYALLLPPSLEIARSSYGMNEIAYVHAGDFMRYLLLPRRPVAPEAARYILCYGCDTDPWDGRTAWLWKNDSGAAIGRVTA